MEKAERILIIMVVLSGIFAFAGLAVKSLFDGSIDEFAAYTLITCIIIAIVNAVKDNI